MIVTFLDSRIERICTDYSEAVRKHGPKMALKIFQRINELTAAPSVETMSRNHIGRCHPFHGDRKGPFAVDLIQPYRLVFQRFGDIVQIVRVLEIIDYH